jgi:hypothetical protein
MVFLKNADNRMTVNMLNMKLKFYKNPGEGGLG